MKSKIQKMLLIAICAMFVVIYVAGCEEQNLSDTKKTRLIASENIELKKQLEKCQTDLAKQRQLRQKEAQKSKSQADNYEEQIKQLQGQTTEYLQQQIESFVSALVEETAKLQQENTALLERIKELEK